MLIDGESLMSFQFSLVGDPIIIEENQVPPDIHRRNAEEQEIRTFGGALISCPVVVGT